MINIKELYDNDTVLWQMSAAERMSLFYTIANLSKRNSAIEIGSYKGGCTRVLSKYFKKVYSCDIDHSNITNKDEYTNVEWLEGRSDETIPVLIERINKSREDINLILIDGDHEYDSVYKDIRNILTYIPKSDCVILMHDSWYEPTRNAISQTLWKDNAYVQSVEKDFVTGDLVGNRYMGGLGIAILSKESRVGDLIIGQAHDYMYREINKLLKR